jgi:UDP-glucose 4-epimerase
MRHLVTGGAGFIGSHLVDALIDRGDDVVVLDNLSTGRIENLEHLFADQGANGSARLRFVEGSTSDAKLVQELMAAVDRCYHLASAVGVQLVCGRPLSSLIENVRGADVVMDAAASCGAELLFASTSEIYGKDSVGSLHEESDRLLGPPTKARWGYATAKAFGEMLAYGYHREHQAPMVVVRLFNTVGPRQSGRYGMVLPRFARQALLEEDLTVFGDGMQSRCFAHVADTVDAIIRVSDAEAAFGSVFNVGTSYELSIVELAERVIERAGSRSEIVFVPFDDAYEDGFEELGRRQPETTAVQELTGWRPRRTIEDAIDDVLEYQRLALGNEGKQARFVGASRAASPG